MTEDYVVFNIRTLLEQEVVGENDLKCILSDFSCQINPDVERFLKENAIDFTKKNQSVNQFI